MEDQRVAQRGQRPGVVPGQFQLGEPGPDRSDQARRARVGANALPGDLAEAQRRFRCVPWP
ncbi:MAG: hypothetical protein M3257_07175 [Actinomycetota bacterium]|nr:hypothetical protein [Actinomycetota bacterium]